MKHYKIFFLIFLILSMTDRSWCSEPPQDVSTGLSTAQTWLNGLTSQTEEQIRKRFGNPSETKTWNFQGKDEPMLEFKLGAQGHSVLLYFYKEKVIKASLQMLSQ